MHQISSKPHRPPGSFLLFSAFIPLWMAMVALQSGFLVHDVSAAWLISHETRANRVIALAQTASSLPFFLLAFPAGTLADFVSRAVILRWVAFFLCGASLALGTAAQFDLVGIQILLAASFFNGCCNAFFTPAWQAMTPDLVKPDRLANALALNSLGVNLARSLGPIIAGTLLYLGGPPSAFFFNALLYAFIGATFAGMAPRAETRARQETFAQMLRGGIVYLRNEPGLQAVALKGASFFFFASTLWALAPVVVHDWFGGTSLMLGGIVGAIGLGAIVAALCLRTLRARCDLDRIILLAGVVGGAALLCAPLAPNPVVFAMVYAVLGFCWLLAFSSVHLAAQLRLPMWIRARGTSLYSTAIFGSIAVGSFTFGSLADAFGLHATYMIAAAGLILAALAVSRLHISRMAPVTLVNSHLLPGDIRVDGPYRIIITYDLLPASAPVAARQTRSLGRVRRKLGARSVDYELVDNRLLERMTFVDADALKRAASRHTSEDIQIEESFIALSVGAPQVSIEAK